jgi:hypothetical protein
MALDGCPEIDASPEIDIPAIEITALASEHKCLHVEPNKSANPASMPTSWSAAMTTERLPQACHDMFLRNILRNTKLITAITRMSQSEVWFVMPA